MLLLDDEVVMLVVDGPHHLAGTEAFGAPGQYFYLAVHGAAAVHGVGAEDAPLHHLDILRHPPLIVKNTLIA